VSGTLVLFTFLAIVAVASALLMVTRLNPITSAIYLVLNFISLAGLYLTLKAQFLAVIQIMVYAGAIMVLVLFVIMLLNLEDERALYDHIPWSKYLMFVLGAAFIVEMITITGLAGAPVISTMSPEAANIGTVEYIGMALYNSYLLPFEMTSILLLSAMIGAIVLAKKRFP